MSESTPSPDSGPHASSERLMYEIVSTVAEAKDCDPLKLRPIARVMNPAAVEAVLSNPSVSVSLGFEYEGGFVRVSEAGVEYELAE